MITDKELERINEARRLRGLPPLTRSDVQAAKQHHSTQGNGQDFETFLILYIILASDTSHAQGGSGGSADGPSVAGFTAGGGTTGGGGASGEWPAADKGLTEPDHRAEYSSKDDVSHDSAPSSESSSPSESSLSSSDSGSSSSSDSGGGGGTD